MAFLLRRSFEFYNKAMVDWSDPGMKDFPLLGSPVQMITIIVMYLLFCIKIGPNFMKNREPYDVKKYIIIYNIFQIFYNACIVIIGIPYIMNLDWRCSPIDSKNNLICLLAFTYFVNKIVDFLDTIFFILKKNQRQVTFLHMYHHVMMVTGGWVAAKYFPGGHTTYIPYFNCIVHAVMYSYYLLCVLSEKHRKNIWWKKYLTQLQIVQFGIVFLIYFQLLFRDCDYPKTFTLLIVIQNVVVTFLFGDFYYKTYIRKKK